MQLNIEQISRAVQGHVIMAYAGLDKLVSGITWDSREVVPGNLYVALPGERVDGHDFVADAFASGARAVLVSHPIPDQAVGACQEAGGAIIHVADTYQAVTDLARAWRGHLGATVIALTGSSGKTTTKNLTRDVLSSVYRVVATRANQNNELGVPRTLLNAEADTQVVIVEMGMRGLHQLSGLCSFVKPDMAVVTNVGTSHIELLGSRENIARAKSEPVAALPSGGTAFLNASDDFTDFICSEAQTAQRGVEVVRYCGTGDADGTAQVYATETRLDADGRPSFELHLPTGTVAVSLSLRGVHNVHNACAAAAVAWKLGMSPQAIAQALGDAQAETGRQEMLHTAAGVTVIDDSYNANPDSMAASLAMFSALSVSGARIAVLGDMGELGSYSRQGHRQVGARAAASGIDRLICVGSLSADIADAAQAAGMDPAAIQQVETPAQALDLLVRSLAAGDAVLVKASHATGLDAVVKGLIR
ncbi:MAG: UDP-N-acetylmuramoyl-tripeptide--D-alanyl-D-alanine ligase [Eggerthellaceae bacterium]|jgi:UDP-N-acetylmuramoyl-tripeptide--D-alanyl-D-alanine ligase